MEGNLRDAKEWLKQGNELHNLGRLEEAVASYDQALTFKPDDYYAWYNRGDALGKLGRLEEALASCDQALKFKPDFHQALFNRSIALRKLGRLEEAVASCDRALKFKPDFHQALFNRGNVLEELGRLKEAVASYDQALKIQPDDPGVWNNRGITLCNLGRLEEAVVSYDQALTFKPDDPEVWYNRGIALRKLGRLEEAVASCDQALTFKPDYHKAWFNRGVAAGKSSSCNPLLASQSAIAKKHPALNQRRFEGELASYQQGLKYCHQDTHPEGWGLLHYAIGNAHYFRGRRDSRPRPYWHKALNSYKQALLTLTAEAFPDGHLEVLQDLIKVYDDLGEAENRQAVLAKGTVLLESLLEKTPSDAVKIRLSRKFSSFAQFYVDQLVQKGDLCGALEFAEQRKNLCLTWMRNIWSNSTYNPNYAQMQQLLQPAAIQLSRGKDGQIYVTLPTCRQSVGHRAIVYWHISPAAITTFILRYNQPLIVVKNDLTPQPPSLQGKGEQEQENQERSSYSPLLAGEGLGERSSYFRQLIELEKWLDTWKKPESWQNEMPNRLKNLSEILNIQGILQHLKGINQLILIPHRDLHLLPLHALFPDNFTSSYLPSIKVGCDRTQPTLNTSLLSIENPTNDLPFLHSALPESQAICKLYSNAHRLTESNATKTAVKIALAQNFGIFHFTGHGTHNLEQPTESALILANNERLTLKDILELDLSSYNLACLAACETNFTSKDGLIDEFIGLASGFVAAGVNNVIGSLWKVNDCSTAYLMAKFHEILRSSNNSDVPSALKEAQEWLRNATNTEIDQFTLERSLTRDKDKGFVRDWGSSEQEKTENRFPDDKPYASPYYWAGFCAIGL